MKSPVTTAIVTFLQSPQRFQTISARLRFFLWEGFLDKEVLRSLDL
jgi:hypothetical protein